MPRLIKYLGTASLAFVLSCGGDILNSYLSDGETIRVGDQQRVAFFSPLSNSRCDTNIGLSTIDCVGPATLSVGLPPELSYGGDPEIVYGFNDFLFGEDNIREQPTVTDCGGSRKFYSFRIDETSIDASTESDDDSILGNLTDDVLDSVTREFRITVRAENAGQNVPIYLYEQTVGIPSCGDVYTNANRVYSVAVVD